MTLTRLAAVRQRGTLNTSPVRRKTASLAKAGLRSLVPGLMSKGLRMPDMIEFICSDEFLHRGQTLYPRQATFLKVATLQKELLTEYDYDVLGQWSEGFRLPEPGEYSEADDLAQFGFRPTGGLAHGIQPDWERRMDLSIAEGRPWFREVQAVLGRRASKGFMGALLSSRVLWHFLLKGNPQDFYGIDADKRLLGIVFAGKRSQAKENQWKDIANVIVGAPCFQPFISRVLSESLTIFAPHDAEREEEMVQAGIISEGDIATFEIVPRESTLMAGRGPTSFLQLYDEVAHMVATGVNRSAEEVYDAAVPSLDQFGTDGFIYLGSSPWQMTGKLYENYQLALSADPLTREPNRPDMLMLQLPSWALYEDWQYAHNLPMTPGDKAPFGARPDVAGVGKKVLVTPGDKAPSEEPRFGPNFPTLKRAIQEYDEQMRRLERANPDTFKVERLAQWAASMHGYLDEAKIAAAFGEWPPGSGESLEMQESGRLSVDYVAHGDPSKINDNFGWVLAHREGPDVNGLYHVVVDQAHAWHPSDYEDSIIDYIAVEADIIERAKAFQPSVISFDQFNCLAADTLVPTADGLMTMGEIAGPMDVGETRPVSLPVQTMDGVACVAEVHRKGPAAVRRIKTKLGNTLSATPEHRIWVKKAKERPWHSERDWEWLEASEIEEGDWLCLRRNNLAPSALVDITPHHPVAKGVSRHWGVTKECGRWLAYGRTDGRSVRIGYFDDEAAAAEAAHNWRQEHPTRGRITRYPSVCDPTLARLLGYVISEGWVGTGFSLTNKSHEVLADVQSCIEESFGGSWPYRYNTAYMGKYERGEIASQALAPFLMSLGCGGKAQEKVVPRVIRRSPKPVVVEFLRGLFEGDGGVAICESGEWVHYTTTSEQLGVQVQQLLLGVGIWSTLWSGTYRYKGEVRPQWRINISGPDLLDFERVVGFLTTEKKARLAEAARITGAKPGMGRRSKNQRHGDHYWVRVASIEEGQADCYDVSVPGPENFIANGVVSHNSVGMIQRIDRALKAAGSPKRTQVEEVTSTAKLNWKMAEITKAALNMGLVHVPYHELLELELRFLQLRGGKVDHPSSGPVQSKDVADALFHCVTHLIGEQMGAFLKGDLAGLSPSGSQQGGVADSAVFRALSGVGAARDAGGRGSGLRRHMGS